MVSAGRLFSNHLGPAGHVELFGKKVSNLHHLHIPRCHQQGCLIIYFEGAGFYF